MCIEWYFSRKVVYGGGMEALYLSEDVNLVPFKGVSIHFDFDFLMTSSV